MKCWISNRIIGEMVVVTYRMWTTIMFRISIIINKLTRTKLTDSRWGFSRCWGKWSVINSSMMSLALLSVWITYNKIAIELTYSNKILIGGSTKYTLINHHTKYILENHHRRGISMIARTISNISKKNSNRILEMTSRYYIAVSIN